MHRVILGILMLGLTIPCGFASNTTINLTQLDNPDLFGGLITDLGTALSYRAVAPAEPLGWVGFDVGIEVSRTRMETGALDDVTNGSASSTLYVPKVHLHKGLPLGFDIGAFYSNIPDSNIEVMGGELRYAIVDGSTLIPAVAIRGTYSALSGVEHFDLTTMGLELSISKGFAMFTPYAGIGTVRIDGASDLTNLVGTSVYETKYFLGLNFNLGLLNFAAETEQMGDSATTSAKVGVRF